MLLKTITVFTMLDRKVVPLEEVQEMQKEIHELRTLIKDLANYGMDYEIATRMENLGIE